MSPTRWTAYSQPKLATHWSRLNSIATPGTRVSQALPSLYAATEPEVVGGGSYGPDGPGQLRGNPLRVLPARERSASKSPSGYGRFPKAHRYPIPLMDPSANRAPHAPDGVPGRVGHRHRTATACGTFGPGHGCTKATTST
jgi:hypothetical protein